MLDFRVSFAVYKGLTYKYISLLKIDVLPRQSKKLSTSETRPEFKLEHPIANMELEKIKPIHIQRCLNTAKNYSTSRQRKVYFLLKRCLNEAVLNEYVTKNAAEKIKPPRNVKKDITLLTSAQLKHLLFEEETPDIRVVVPLKYYLVFSGAIIGENTFAICLVKFIKPF